MKRIGVLTSGGDTPGMNAAIRAVQKMGVNLGYTVMGIYHGYTGLLQGNITQLQAQDVSDIVHKGGTILRTARCLEFKTDEGQQKGISVIKAYGLDGIVVIGGDGSFRGVKALADRGVCAIGVPGTIDNDMGYTDYTIGFDTATNNVTQEIYKIRDTMLSHDRVAVVEVMGRACGDIALVAGVASGADIILVPERPRPWAEVVEQLKINKLKGKLTSIVLIAEGAGKAQDFAKYVSENSDVDIRPIVLGYTQRGGQPSSFDRILASRMGAYAVELIDRGAKGRAVGIRGNRIVDDDITEALEMQDALDVPLLQLNETLAWF